MLRSLPFIHIVFTGIAIALFCFAPQYYDQEYCALVMCAFLAQNICHFMFGDRRNWLGFELFFAISFFLVVFTYSVFIRPVHLGYVFFQYPYNRNIDTFALAVANLGYAFYMLGITPLRKRDDSWQKKPQFVISERTYRLFFLIFVLMFGGYLAFGGLTALQSVYAGGGSLTDVGIYSYFGNLYTCAAYLLAIFLFCLPTEKRFFYMGMLAVLMLIILSTGSRHLVLSLALILLVGFHIHVRRFKWWEMCTLILVGGFTLFSIQVGRKTGISLDIFAAAFDNVDSESIWGIFDDLIINGVNLFVLVDYYLTNGPTWFQSMQVDIASVIPGLGSYIISNADYPHEFLTGGDLPTYLILGPDSVWGIGTVMVGEAYRSFGPIGMCVAMWATGVVIRVVSQRAMFSQYWYALSFLFISHAIIWARGPFLFDPRTVVWTLLMLWGTTALSNILNRLLHDQTKEVIP